MALQRSKARAHLRRRKIAVRAALAGGTAAVTAAAVVAATGAGQGTPGLPRAHTAAYVISNVENALAATNEVVQTETVFSAPYPPVMGWVYRTDTRVAQSGFIPPAMAQGMPWAQGRVNWAVGTTKVHGRRIYAQIDYRHHEWANAGILGFPPNACTVRLDIVEFNSPANWAPYLRQALACGLFKVTGHAKVNGVETIKLTGSMTDRHFWSQLPHGEGSGPLQVDATLYVNPKTYLPVLVIWNNRTHYRDGRPLDGLKSRENITALPPLQQHRQSEREGVPFRLPQGAEQHLRRPRVALLHLRVTAAQTKARAGQPYPARSLELSDQHRAQQIRRRGLQLLVQKPGRVDTARGGHRRVSFGSTVRGLPKNHAVAALRVCATPISGPGRYTTLVDATVRSCP